jgi:hypothetical protein
MAVYLLIFPTGFADGALIRTGFHGGTGRRRADREAPERPSRRTPCRRKVAMNAFDFVPV